MHRMRTFIQSAALPSALVPDQPTATCTSLPLRSSLGPNCSENGIAASDCRPGSTDVCSNDSSNCFRNAGNRATPDDRTRSLKSKSQQRDLRICEFSKEARTDEVEPALSTECVSNEADHFVQTEPSFDGRRPFSRLSHLPVHL